MKHLSVVLALFATSCSFVFSRPPDRARRLPLCQPNYAPPVVDTSQAIGSGILTLALLAAAADEEVLGLLAAISGTQTAIYTASAAHGFRHARACREQREEVARRAPMWIAPSLPPGERPTDGIEGPPGEGPPVEVEQQVDVNEDQIDIHTTIRRTR